MGIPGIKQAGMRVALVSTPFVSTPPRGYGGTELVVAELARALALRGADVVVYATGDSELEAPAGARGSIEVRSWFDKPVWPPESEADRTHSAWCLRDIARDPRGFDVVHLHTIGALEMVRLCPFPMVYTIHHLAEPALTALYQQAQPVRLVAISRRQAELEPALVSTVVHHGLDPAEFPFVPDQGYLLFLGRYSRVKGCVEAIETAVRAGLPLVMAGEPHELDYYEQEVLPLIRRHGVLEVGPVGGKAKQALIARARALLFPIQWEEPFGLVMIEAMLSGVPVIAADRGSVGEVVEDGVTGTVCATQTEMVAAARISATLFDRAKIRARAQQRWSSARMASDYLRLYEQLISSRLVEQGASAAEG
jgi:glycosyltransferase involved in cell wall biosynthesis